MNMKRALLPVVAAALLLSSTGPAAQPPSGPEENPGAGKNGCPHRMWADLKMTDAQKEQLKTLHEEIRNVREKHREAVKAVREKMKAELLKPDPSQNTLYGYAGELGELHKQMSKDQGDHFLKVKKVLSPEQFKQLVEKDDRMMKPGKGGGVCPMHMGGKHKGDAPPKGDCPHGGEKANSK